MNNLIKRWNKPESQANFYLKSAIGAALSDKADFESKKFCWFIGISTDWENQGIFTICKSLHKAFKIKDFYTQFIHLGIAPYI